jgi:hypothetical protein
MQEFSNSCFKLTGAGSVFCTAKNCTVAHRGGAIMEVSGGDISICKSTTEAFVEPRMSSNSIDPEALEDWEALSLSFDAWSDKFLMASAADDGAPASNAAMEVQEDFFKNQTLTFKTPAKRKRTLDKEAMELITAIPYSPMFKDDEDLVLGDLSEGGGLLSRVDLSVAIISGTLVSFLKDYKKQSDKASIAISALWFHLESMASLLGSRPVELPRDYQTPSAWVSIDQMATMIEKVKRTNVPIKSIETLVLSIKTDGQTHVNDKISILQSTKDSKVRALRTLVLDVVRSLGSRMGALERQDLPVSSANIGESKTSNQDQEMESRLGRLETQIKSLRSRSGDIGMLESDISSRVEKRLDLMDFKVGKMLLKGDDAAIKFANRAMRIHGWRKKCPTIHPG